MFAGLAVIAILLPCSALCGEQAAVGPSVPAAVGESFGLVEKWLHENNLSLTTSPEQAFTDDHILVAGEGLPARGAASPGERRLTAERAATVMAYRQMAEMLYGVSVAGDTLVRGATDQHDLVRTAVAGFVKGSEVVHKEYSEKEGVALVILKVGRSGPAGFGSLLYRKILGDPSLKKEMIGEGTPFRAPPSAAVAPFDGLIVDATTQAFRPALINRIMNGRGEMLYDPSKVSQKILVERGCGEYTNSVPKAKEALESRGVKNALVVTASGTSNSTDLLVSDDDAVRIFSADQKAGFLAGARVAFVLK
jgi:hypothetical protein